MNENINLCEILKECPKGTKLYSTVYGDVEFNCVDSDSPYPIFFDIIQYEETEMVAEDGRLQKDYDGECILFPSKDQRDWSKWKCPIPKFDPETLQP